MIFGLSESRHWVCKFTFNLWLFGSPSLYNSWIMWWNFKFLIFWSRFLSCVQQYWSTSNLSWVWVKLTANTSPSFFTLVRTLIRAEKVCDCLQHRFVLQTKVTEPLLMPETMIIQVYTCNRETSYTFLTLQIHRIMEDAMSFVGLHSVQLWDQMWCHFC